MNENKLVRLIKYLQELSKLKTKPITTIEKYEKNRSIIWLKDLIKISELCDFDRLGEEDYLIRVKKPKEPEKPIEIKNYDEDSLKTATDPNIKRIYEEYQTKYNEWVYDNSIYNNLHEIYRETQKETENFELILAFGLLSWRSLKTEQLYKRHVVSLKVSIEYNLRTKEIIIKKIDTDKILKLETDFIQPEDLPPGIQDFANRLYNAIESNGLSLELIKDYLKQFAHLLHPDGKFEDDWEPDIKSYPESPTINFAPAIIFRNRSVGPFYDFLEALQNLFKSTNTYSIFREFAEDINYELKDILPETEEAYSKLYFPKPYNEEQSKVVNKLKNSNVVLVQGPPGTGKSHTIANLISHFLAYGKTILITSKSPRALSVLKNLLPESLRILCVSAIEEGRDKFRELEVSLNGILNEVSNLEETDLKNQIQIKEEELKKLIVEEEKLRRVFSETLELENKNYRINENYKGKRCEIAKLVKENADKFLWFKDKVYYEKPYPFYDRDFENLLQLLRYFSNKEFKTKLQYPVPPEDKILNYEVLKKLFEEEGELNVKIEKIEQKRSKACIGLIKNTENLDSLKTNLGSYMDKLSSALQYISYSEYKEIFREHYYMPESMFFNLFKDSEEKWNSIKKKFETYKKTKIEVLEKISIDTLSNDVKLIKSHFECGGSKGWFIFKPKVLKERKYLFEKILINGKRCKEDLYDIDILYNYLNLIDNILKELSKWNYLINEDLYRHYEIASLFKKYEHFMEYLKMIFEIKTLKKNIEKFIDQNKIDLLDLNAIESLLLEIEVIEKENKLKQVREKIEEYQKFLTNYVSNPFVEEMIKALKKRDELLYSKAYNQLITFLQEVRNYKKFEKELEEIKIDLPHFIRELLENPYDKKWDEIIYKLPDAWKWAQAKDWLDRFSKEDYESINKRLMDVEQEKFKVTEELVRLKAFMNLKSKLTIEDQKNMIVWKQCMQRLGKGTGKYVYRYRREAQKYLSKVSHVIPAWIMPLYRIWDTIKPSEDKFDLLIIDEASQIGFEGIPLLHLAKKVIVIGDDKQIVPEAVGINREDVHRLIREFLYDFKYPDSFYVENSLFHHIELRYSHTKIILREHFRCMREIIGFSNRLSYQEMPLIPLRRYPPERLNPLEKTYVEDAYCEGEGQNIRNEREAEEIVKKIKEICEDERYKEKTIGVIVLQGKEQAWLIERKLYVALPEEEIQKRKIICGDPYTFQGDERDVIFLSMVIAPNKRIGVLSDENDRRRFNVAVSRARDQVWLFHSVWFNDLSPKCFRRFLLEYFYNYKPRKIQGISLKELEEKAYYSRHLEKPPEPFDSWFEVDVALDLARMGYYLIPQYRVGGDKYHGGGYRIDLVVVSGYNMVAIECDGDRYHDIEAIERDLFRQRVLERAGWKFFRILASEYYYKKQKVLDDLTKFFQRHNIFPKQIV
ncbi:MAG: AAA domain-containing protein [Caldimicrobium sp.]